MKHNIPDVYWKTAGIPIPEQEHRFHVSRRWRIDYAWPKVKLAVEIEGGAFIHGRHTRPIGFLGDMEKYNALTESGWALLRYQPAHINFTQIASVYHRLRDDLL